MSRAGLGIWCENCRRVEMTTVYRDDFATFLCDACHEEIAEAEYREAVDDHLDMELEARLMGEAR